VLREFFVEELEGGVLESGSGNAVAWCKILASPQSNATPLTVDAQIVGAPAKRPFRAMSAPFVVASAPPKQQDRPVVEGTAPQPSDYGNTGAEVDESATSLGVYVANVPYHADEAQLKHFFENRCALGSVKDVRLLLGPDGNAKGAAIVKFETVEAASRARALDGTPGLEGRKLIVKEDRMPGDLRFEGKGRLKGSSRPEGKAGKKGEGKDPREGKAKGDGKRKGESKAKRSEGDDRSVVVKNLSFDATDANLGALFAECGEISAVRLARDRGSGKSKGFAVVEFTQADSVARALKCAGQEVRGRAVRVEALGAPAATLSTDKKDELDGCAAANQPESTATNANDCLQGDTAPAISEAGLQDRGKEAVESPSERRVGDSEGCQEPPRKRSRSKQPPQREPSRTYLDGEAGFQAVIALVSTHGSAESILAAEGADALKERLVALGLKASGLPLDRAQRLIQLKDLASLEMVPFELLAKPTKRGGRGIGGLVGDLAAPVKFVKAGETAVVDDGP
jgi:RNA recognition motif-containing protein